MIILIFWFVNYEFRQALFVLLRQRLGGRHFKLMKQKNRNDKRGQDDKLLPDVDCLTPVVHWVRQTWQDEFLRMINVLNHDMIRVDHRTLLVEYVSSYNAQQPRRNEVKPRKRSKWALVKGPNAASCEEKLKMDVCYVDIPSFVVDMRIRLLNVVKVIRSEGIQSAQSLVTMEIFTGNR